MGGAAVQSYEKGGIVEEANPDPKTIAGKSQKYSPNQYGTLEEIVGGKGSNPDPKTLKEIVGRKK
jgi:hypothetical protein